MTSQKHMKNVSLNVSPVMDVKRNKSTSKHFKVGGGSRNKETSSSYMDIELSEIASNNPSGLE